MTKDVGHRTKDVGESPTTHHRRPASSGVAVMALQGDFDAHRRKLAEIGVDSFEARRPEQLQGADGLILPGGESTTMWKFFETSGWEDAIRRFAAAGNPILGTCAGAILLASDVTSPSQKGLGLLDIGVERNAYGRQLDSFIGQAEAPRLGGDLPAVFIRAPRIRRVGPRVETLATLDGEPVLVRSGNVVAATFHPELTGDRRVHEMTFGARQLERQAG
ncbi:MAG TPA: pyridoxal 5'-phosphate synthase glutaminase subunit PdxT [Thermoanaerobaculia bacterium]